MDIDDMTFTSYSMFPATPAFPGDLQEFFYHAPLAGCPEEIHPKSTPIKIKSPEFFPFGGGVIEIPGYRPSDYAVCGWIIHHHEMVANRPQNPDFQVVRVPESFGVI
jgi:hypothetical protein